MLRFNEGFCAVDTVLMNRVYIPLSRLAGHRWGSTACSLSRACIAPLAVFHTIRIIALGLAPPASSPLAIFCDVAFGLLIAALLWLAAGRADLVPNPYSIEPPTTRYLILVLSLAFIPLSYGWGALHDIAASVDAVMFISYIYFRAVPAPPPKKKRVPKGWLQPAQLGNAL